MSAGSVSMAAQAGACAGYAQSLLDNIKGLAAPSGIDIEVEEKLAGAVKSNLFLQQLLLNKALTVGGSVATTTTDASGGQGAAATNAALTAVLITTG